ncbi:MAG: hypothetical protein ABRQ37_18785 [Candidatus Eremiobacterota bacterium]
MLIKLYEAIYDQDYNYRLGRLVGEVRCKGDGTKGEIVWFPAADEIREVIYAEDPYSGKVICNDFMKQDTYEEFDNPINITTGGGIIETKDGPVSYRESKNLKPWYRETIEHILEWRLRGCIRGRIVEE